MILYTIMNKTLSFQPWHFQRHFPTHICHQHARLLDTFHLDTSCPAKLHPSNIHRLIRQLRTLALQQVPHITYFGILQIILSEQVFQIFFEVWEGGIFGKMCFNMLNFQCQWCPSYKCCSLNPMRFFSSSYPSNIYSSPLWKYYTLEKKIWYGVRVSSRCIKIYQGLRFTFRHY